MKEIERACICEDLPFADWPTFLLLLLAPFGSLALGPPAELQALLQHIFLSRPPLLRLDNVSGVAMRRNIHEK